jgi:hypothetical protein
MGKRRPISYPTLQKWGDEWCPWLGRKMRTNPKRGPLGKEYTYYARSDGRLIRDEWAKRDAVPEYEGVTPLTAAAAEAGVSVTTIRNALETAPKLLPGKDKIGRATKRPYLPDEFAGAFKAGRVSRLAADECTTGGAAEVLGVTHA